MLSLSGEQRSRTTRRPPRSLKQEYQEFLLQRIEEYKNALTREDLLEIGDEAVRELEESAAEQYLLTEVLLLEHVDRIIARRLRLPSFPRWRQKHRALRAAQRAPTHWGLESDGPLVNAVRRLEPGDTTPRCSSSITTSGPSKARRAGPSRSSSRGGSRRSWSRSAAGFPTWRRAW